MNKIVEKLMSTMSKSPTDLTEKNCKKIHTYMPVPNDYNILWADITSFLGYPAGIVITDKGIVFKASRKALKENRINSKENKREKEMKIYYQIIPWEYFSPEEYVFVRECIEGKDIYVLKADGKVISMFDNKDVYMFFKNYGIELERIEAEAYDFNAEFVFSEVETLGFEQTAFHAAYGTSQSKTGHGIYAEEAGAILDKIHGNQSTVVGRNNAKNGPDKIVNGNPVQCKFCKNASSSIQACFKKNPDTGVLEYRYFDLKSGKPMQVEVPSDQYEKAIQYMQNKIKKGQVPGITDPEVAKDLIRKSRLTYNQARNLAKAGTFESLTYDVATGMVTCTFVAGISSLVSFGLMYWQTKDRKKAQDAAVDAVIQVFGPTLAANVISNQIARTGLTNVMTPMSDKVISAMGTKTVQKLINVKRGLMGQNKISGGAANKSFSKALRSNVVSEGVMLIVFSVPDIYRVIMRKISGAQYLKNMLSLGATFLGNITGTYGTAFAVGAIGEKLGSRILDFGCGSGRDTKYFLEKGYQVEATDGSSELCKLASAFTGIEVKKMLFQELNASGKYEGIWACSSILHLPKKELLPVIQKMCDALKNNGVIYTSFKYGDFEGERNGRYFTDFTEDTFDKFIKVIPELTIEEEWITSDVRPGRGEERWLNLILRKIQK